MLLTDKRETGKACLNEAHEYKDMTLFGNKIQAINCITSRTNKRKDTKAGLQKYNLQATCHIQFTWQQTSSIRHTNKRHYFIRQLSAPLHSRPFRVTAGGAAVAATPVHCESVSVLLKFNVLQLIFDFSNHIQRKRWEKVFLLLTDTRHVECVVCMSKVLS